MTDSVSLRLQAVAKKFGNTEIIRGVDLEVFSGERVAIIGPNGAGKSTLFNLISGRFAPTSGQIYLNQQRIDGCKPFEINRLGLSRSFQITNIFPKLSVFENLRCAVLWGLGHRYSFWSFLDCLRHPRQDPRQCAGARGLFGQHGRTRPLTCCTSKTFMRITAKAMCCKA
jgi:branched-chain amino acid transport system ATP-binding protein